MNRSAVVLAVAAAGLIVFPAAAGPDWIEGGENDGNFLPDAGPLPGSAQKITGNGPLGSISGRISGFTEGGAGGDFQDMYLIQISDFNDFFVSSQNIVASGTEGTGALFDTSLFLFTGPDHPLGAGVGILANLLGPGSDLGEAAFGGSPTDGSSTPELISGLSYYLAIAGAGTLPVDAFGNMIFSFGTNPNEISGPDGEAGFNPIAGWVGEGATGIYFIPSIFGVNTVPTPATTSLVALAALSSLARRRRES